MGETTGRLMPRARTEDLIVEELPDELLVYDLKTDKAHCLNRASAVVWKCCDGRMTVDDAARRLGTETGAPADEEVVLLALRQLGRYRLLREGTGLPASGVGVTRRELVRKYLPLALALPAIISVSAPTAAQVGSVCVGVSCGSNSDCCSGFRCAIPPDAVRGVCIADVN
jgi:hypothetical protein